MVTSDTVSATGGNIASAQEHPFLVVQTVYQQKSIYGNASSFNCASKMKRLSWMQLFSREEGPRSTRKAQSTTEIVPTVYYLWESL